MNQADRIFRILFRALPLTNFLQDSHNLFTPCLSFDDKSFCESICKEYLNIYPNNYSYDEVNNLLARLRHDIKSAYPASISGESSPLFLFAMYAKQLFTLQNNQLLLKFEHLLEWDGFANKVDPILFQAAFLANTCQGTTQPPIATCSPFIQHTEKRLYKILAQGAYETHMHLNGSGYSWEINWHNLACCTPLTYHKKCCDGTLSFLDCISVFRLQTLRTYLLSIAMSDTVTPRILPHQISRLLASSCELDYFQFRDALRRIHQDFDTFAPDVSENPQAVFLKERFLLTLLFSRLHHGTLPTLAQNLLMIYIHQLCTLRFCFVQDNIGMGFDKFKQSEQLKECFFQKKDDEKLLLSVLDKYYSEGFVEGIELRIAPKRKKDLIRKVKQIDLAHQKIYAQYLAKNPQLKPMQLGIIIHYIKNADHPLARECRHAALRDNVQKQSVSLTRYFETIKADRPHIPILAVDAANTEINCSPEVFAPIFRQHRKEIAAHQPLGFTYHVGEDFLNLSSGLRVIDDVLNFFNFTRGDRLGHAIALGTDVTDYLTAKRHYIFGTLQSMVDDYAWLYDIIAAHPNSSCSDLLMRLERSYQQHAQLLFQGVSLPIPSIQLYRQSYLLRGDDPTLFQECFTAGTLLRQTSAKFNCENQAHQHALASPEAQALYLCYHYNPLYRKNSETPTQICADETYQEATTLAQMLLRQKVYARKVCIETNPTSNKRISYRSTYVSLPLLDFNTYGLSTPTNAPTNYKANKQHLSVSINTDDSGIFQTNLSNEYSYIAAALLRQNYEAEETFTYIDHIRMLSKATTFLSDQMI
ncbi:MAG: hypothetical protein R3Y06_00605 [Faecalibacterium sp.]